MQPSENVPDQRKPKSSPSLVVTRVVPLLLAVQVLLTLGIYPFLPNTVPSHWNAAGQIDSYAAKWVYAGSLPLFSLFLYVILLGAFFAFSRASSGSQDRRAQQMEVTTTQAAALLAKSEDMIQQYIQDGKLQARHLADGRTVVNLDELATVRFQAQSPEAAKMILKFVMLMQQVLFLIIQAILLLMALHAGIGAVR
jgi:Protein of unknown function (DUF1648)